MLNRQDLDVLGQLLRDAAERELRPRFLEVKARLKADGSLITEADLGMQARLVEELRRRWPAFTLLGEEMETAQQEALLKNRGEGLWVLDPLDGTSNFASGIPFFGVSLALLGEGGVQAGLVLDPVRDECFSALRGEGAWLNGDPLHLKAQGRPLREAMATVDFKRLPADLASRLACEAPYRSQRSFGSVALDWCWLASARIQVYLHGGQRLWDYAAGSLIFAESGGLGGLYRDFQGEPESDQTLQPRIGMGATEAELFDAWRNWISEREGQPPAD